MLSSNWGGEWARVSAGLARWALTKGLSIVGILLATWLLIALGKRLLRRFETRLKTEDAQSGRGSQRSATLVAVTGHTFTIAVGVTATLLAFNQVGLNLGPLLAGAGIAGLAIGFGAQTLVKDIVSGFFILLEDQYRVGDTVEIEGATGVVENFTLRQTCLRCPDGRLFHISNGAILKLFNASATPPGATSLGKAPEEGAVR